MLVNFLKKENYLEWDKFCLECEEAWFWHTSKWLEYTLNLRPHLNPKSKSFFITIDTKIVAICPLIIEEKQGIKEFSYDGSYCQIPVFANLSKKLRDKVEKRVFEEIDKLAEQEGISKVSFKCSPLADYFIKAKKPSANPLLKHNYLDNTWNTQIIEFNKSLEEIRKEVRHGHDAAIDSASKVLEAVVFHKDNTEKEDFNLYCELHHKAAGRITRPQITFDVMFDWIKEGQGFLVGAKKQGKFIGFAYFNLYKNKVYYNSAANDPEIEGISIGHFVLWKAIEYMKKINVEFFDIGYQDYGPTLHKVPTEKDIQISLFKRGFGGFTVPLFSGEKYYQKEYLQNNLKIKTERYLETQKNNNP